MLYLMAVLVFAQTEGGCMKDTDCKGDRICEAGRCVNPPASLTPTPDAPPSYAKPPLSAAPVGLRVSRGWARAAGTGGLIGAGVTAALTIVSLLVGPHAAPWFLVGALSTSAVMVPVVASGGWSTRHDETGGVPGLRVAGWICYGVAGLFLTDALVGSIIAVSSGSISLTGEGPVFLALAAAFGALSVASTVFLSIDALVSAGQAAQSTSTQASTVHGAPFLTLLPAQRRWWRDAGLEHDVLTWPAAGAPVVLVW